MVTYPEFDPSNISLGGKSARGRVPVLIGLAATSMAVEGAVSGHDTARCANKLPVVLEFTLTEHTPTPQQTSLLLGWTVEPDSLVARCKRSSRLRLPR